MPKLNWNKVSGDIINSFKGEPLEVYSGQEQSLVLKTMPVGMSVCLVQIYILKTTDKWLELMEYYCHLKWDSQNNRIEYEGSMNRKGNAINMSTGLPRAVEGWTQEGVPQGCGRTRPWGCSPPFSSPGMPLVQWPALLAGLPGRLRGKDSACDAGDVDSIPGLEDPLEEGMATHFSVLAWRIPWTEEPAGLQSIHRVSKSWTWLKWFNMQACSPTGQLLRTQTSLQAVLNLHHSHIIKDPLSLHSIAAIHSIILQRTL